MARLKKMLIMLSVEFVGTIMYLLNSVLLGLSLCISYFVLSLMMASEMTLLLKDIPHYYSCQHDCNFKSRR